MAKTQIRLTALTGSIGSGAGQINDSTSASSVPVTDDLAGVLSHMASAIKRIHGQSTFAEAEAGVVGDLKPATHNNNDIGGGSSGSSYAASFFMSSIVSSQSLSSSSKVVRFSSSGGIGSIKSGDKVIIGDFTFFAANDAGANVVFASGFGSFLGSATTNQGAMGSITLGSGTSTITFGSASSLTSALGSDIRGGDILVIGDANFTITSTYSSGASISVTHTGGSQDGDEVNGGLTCTLATGASGAASGIAIASSPSASGSESPNNSTTSLAIRNWRKLNVNDINIAGQGRIDLDLDNDTSIRSSADDQIDFEIAGTDMLQMYNGYLVPTVNKNVGLGTPVHIKGGDLNSSLASAITNGQSLPVTSGNQIMLLGNSVFLSSGSSISGLSGSNFSASTISASDTTLSISGSPSVELAIGTVIGISDSSGTIYFGVTEAFNGSADSSLLVKQLTQVSNSQASSITVSGISSIQSFSSFSNGYSGSTVAANQYIQAFGSTPSDWAVFQIKTMDLTSSAPFLIVEADQNRSTVQTWSESSHTATVMTGGSAANEFALGLAYARTFMIPSDGKFALRGVSNALRLDADEDTHISAPNDDQIDFAVGGVDALVLTDGHLQVKGTTPKVTIGDAGAEDTFLVFDGNAEDYRIGIDDGTDVLEIGSGAAHGSQIAIKIDGSENVDIAAHDASSVGLKLGGTLVTASAAELNLLDGVSGLVQSDFTKLAAVDATAAEIDLLDGIPRGSIIVGNSSGASARLALGSANTVLTSDGSDIAYAQVSNSMLAGSIANNKLANDGITIGSTDTSLGDTITALAGMTAVTVDNLTLDGNTLSSSSGGSGHIILNPNGSGEIQVSSAKITGLASPAADTDAANKGYVDGLVEGISAKTSVVAATTANITISSDLNVGDSIDGVTLADGDRVLVKNQSTASENGIYVAGSSPARSDDLAASADAAGVFVFVESGSTQGDTGFLCSSNKGSATVGTHSLTFVQFSAAGQTTGGDGIDRTGLVIKVDLPSGNTGLRIDGSSKLDTKLQSNSGIDVGSSGLKLNLSASGIEGTLAVADGGTGITSISSGQVLYSDGTNSIAAAAPGSTSGVQAYDADLDTLSSMQSGGASALAALTSTEIAILDGALVTTAELNIMDGDTSATSTTLADADRIVVNDDGTMKQVALSDLEVYMEASLDTMGSQFTSAASLATVGTLNSGAISSGFGAIDVGSSTIGTTGAVTAGSVVGASSTLNVGASGDADALQLGAQSAAFANDVDVNIAKTAGLQLGGTAVTSTAAELNLLDGTTSVGSSITIADADGMIIHDGGTMKTIPMSDLKAYVGGGRTKKVGVVGNAGVAAGSVFTISGLVHDLGADPDRVDVYLNGQLMMSGSGGTASGDYQVHGTSKGVALTGVSVGSLSSATFSTSTTSVAFSSQIGSDAAAQLPNGSGKVLVMENADGTIRFEGDINSSLSSSSTSIGVANVRVYNPQTDAAVANLASSAVSTVRAGDDLTVDDVTFFFALEKDDVVTVVKM